MIEVVAAIIINNEDKILIAKRKSSLKFGGLWEFPGGKVEKGEAYEDTAIRELKEEMHIDIKVVKYFGETVSNDKDKGIKLIGFKCTIIKGDIILTDHDEYKWVSKDELINYELTPADKYFAYKLI
ncbi:MAG TPA: (deoxy)nucleoside triphosphate pyrophosphohydrolase, partial [Peptostreptococcaceae bacterium]|nr:(deoxy)nucleoside triphosphate pyrophosphohydrolase [Peptostreptococcaceae bacterium]